MEVSPLNEFIGGRFKDAIHPPPSQDFDK